MSNSKSSRTGLQTRSDLKVSIIAGMYFGTRVIIVSMLSSSVAYSVFAAELVGTTTRPSTTTTQTASTTTPGTSAPTAPSFTLPSTGSGGSGGGAGQAGSSSGAQQIMGAGLNLAFGAYAATKCNGTASSAIFCMMAAQSLMQATSLFGSGGGANNAGNGMSASAMPTYDNGSGSPTTPPGLNSPFGGLGGPGGSTGGPGAPNATNINIPTTPAAVQAGINGLKSTLGKAGVTVGSNGQTFTLPDGKTVQANASGAAGLAAAGFSQGQIEAGMALSKTLQEKFKDQIKAVQMAGADGGGGGGLASRGPASEDGGGFGLKGRMPWDKTGRNKKASVSGMSKKLGDDNIGVAGDNIFDMVTRRYKSKDAQNAFLK